MVIIWWLQKMGFEGRSRHSIISSNHDLLEKNFESDTFSCHFRSFIGKTLGGRFLLNKEVTILEN